MKTVRFVLVSAALLVGLSACSSSDDKGNAASFSELCAKCASCFAQDSTFQEGFCDDFWDGSSFDTNACASQASASELDSQPSKSELDGMSCTEFDNAI